MASTKCYNFQISIAQNFLHYSRLLQLNDQKINRSNILRGMKLFTK